MSADQQFSPDVIETISPRKRLCPACRAPLIDRKSTRLNSSH